MCNAPHQLWLYNLRDGESADITSPRSLMMVAGALCYDFREDLAKVGIALREIERVPHLTNNRSV